MATRSTISIKLEDNSILSVYSHFDGYVTGVGRKLVEFYNDYELAKNLILLGGISSLGTSIETTDFYNRDRKEDLDIYEYPDMEIYLQEGIYQDYNYIWLGSRWYLIEDQNTEIQNLEQLIKDKYAK